MSKSPRLPYISLLAISIIGLLIYTLLAISAKEAVRADQPILHTFDPNDKLIQSLEEELKNAPDEATRMQIEGKLAILYREATARADAYLNIPRAPRNPGAPTPSIEIEEVKQTGIIDEPFISIRPDVFQSTNGWQEKIGDSWVHVTAGILTKEPSQGVLFVDFYGGSTHIGKFIPMPSKDGPVRIVDAKGYRLELETEGGSKFYFDVAGLAFAGSMDEIVPTITPPPAEEGSTGTPLPPYP